MRNISRCLDAVSFERLGGAFPRATAALALLAALASTRIAGADDALAHFEATIRPVLVERCVTCHGSERVEGGVRVDSREALLAGGDSGPAVVPGDSGRSPLIALLDQGHGDPTLAADATLRERIVADFTVWIERGAVWPDSTRKTADPRSHWAFQPVRSIPPPEDPTGWSRGRIDAFVRATMRENRLGPALQAARRALMRRVSFDLVGLPPSPDEVADFLADDAPDAFERLVDRLLASPRYGERWGRHWMDVVRYADTAGDNADYPIPEIRRYRDAIIDAFNADKPYDEFVREQLAGDILARSGPPERHAERIVATGFLALSRRYATAPYELWHLTLEDSIEATGRAFLGLTLRCARCHDHKFDPVTMEDYYALYGIFASTTYPYAGSEEFQSQGFNRLGFVPILPPAEARPIVAAHEARIHELTAEIERIEKQREAVAGEARQELDRRLGALRGELRNAQRPGVPAGLAGAYAVGEGKPVAARIHRRGDPADPGEEVRRGVPRFLAGDRAPSFPEGESGRLQLAEWITDPRHPLTARVMVNRIWQHHFGRGIVETPSNFGLSGARPTHPELLDSLADRFVESGWSVKTMQRLVVTSSAYRLSSEDGGSRAERDPQNLWLSRHARRRLDAEAIRDALLATGGNLDLGRPGRHPFPPIEQWRWTQHNPFKAVYPSRHRSVYLMTQRIQRHPFLALFDGPDPNSSTGKRTSATVPLQALYMINNPFVAEQAEGLARCLLSLSRDTRERIERAYELAYARPPSAPEQERGVAYLESYTAGLERATAPPERVEIEAWTSYARILLTANEFVYVD